MASSGQRKTRVGDVLEIATPNGLAYVQYVGKHSEYGDVVHIVSKCHQQRPANLSPIINAPGYLAFYPARLAVNSGLANIVETHDLPSGVELPMQLRRAGARLPDRTIATWIVEHNGQETVHRELSDDQKGLPIAAIWNHELLIQRIVEGWTPQKEG